MKPTRFSVVGSDSEEDLIRRLSFTPAGFGAWCNLFHFREGGKVVKATPKTGSSPGCRPSSEGEFQAVAKFLSRLGGPSPRELAKPERPPGDP